MSWELRGRAYASCSCSVGCPCAMGEMTTAGSDGCSAVQVIMVDAGHVGEIDVSGVKVAAAVDWPGALLGGGGVGRFYFDPEMSDEQRAGLEAVLTGKLGGSLESMSQLLSEVLPPEVAAIRVESDGDASRIVVGEVGEVVVEPMRATDGEHVRLLNGAGGFRDDVVLAHGSGSRWQDPQLKQWESGGYGEQAEFDWSDGSSTAGVEGPTASDIAAPAN